MLKDAFAPFWPDVTRGPVDGLLACRVGPQLAGTLHRSSSTGGRDKALKLLEQLPGNTRVFFLFGEIDCRAHMVRRAGYDDGRLEAVARETVANYAVFLSEARRVATALSLPAPGVIAPPPTAMRRPHTVLGKLERSLWGRIPLRILREFLPRGSALRENIGIALTYAVSPAQRLRASRLFRDVLEDAARELDLPFIDGFVPFLQEDGWPDPALYWDGIHLRHEAVLRLAPAFAALGLPHLEAARARSGPGLRRPSFPPGRDRR